MNHTSEALVDDSISVQFQIATGRRHIYSYKGALVLIQAKPSRTLERDTWKHVEDARRTTNRKY